MKTLFLVIASLTLCASQTNPQLDMQPIKPGYKVQSDEPNVKIYLSDSRSKPIGRSNQLYSSLESGRAMQENAFGGQAFRNPILIRYSKNISRSPERNTFAPSAFNSANFPSPVFKNNPMTQYRSMTSIVPSAVLRNPSRNVYASNIVSNSMYGGNIFSRSNNSPLERQLISGQNNGETVVIRRIVPTKNGNWKSSAQDISSKSRNILPEIIKGLIESSRSNNGSTRYIQIDDGNKDVVISAFDSQSKSQPSVRNQIGDQMASRSDSVLKTEKAPLKLFIIEGNPLVVDNNLFAKNADGSLAIPSAGNLVIGSESKNVEQYNLPKIDADESGIRNDDEKVEKAGASTIPKTKKDNKSIDDFSEGRNIPNEDVSEDEQYSKEFKDFINFLYKPSGNNNVKAA